MQFRTLAPLVIVLLTWVASTEGKRIAAEASLIVSGVLSGPRTKVEWGPAQRCATARLIPRQVAINTTVYQRPGAMSGSPQRDPPSSFLALSPPHPSSSQPPSLTAAELDACAGYRRLPQAALHSILAPQLSNLKNDEYRAACTQEAENKCPAGEKSPAWVSYFQTCMQRNWHDSNTNSKCLYKGIDCRAYNGCVADQWHKVPDVGASCWASCQKPDYFGECNNS
ncbi:hypothetical protein V8E36_002105 [Tilletia maclaganii]